jgi:hypothetical protein
MQLRWVVFAICVPASNAAAAAQPEPAAFCRPGMTDDTLRPLALPLAAAASKAFHLRNETAGDLVRTTVMRCMDGRLLACNAGANLPCGKADTDRSLPQGAPWCRTHPEADFIPAYISGHASIFQWRCRDGQPATTGQAEPIDAQGFIARYWKALPQ